MISLFGGAPVPGRRRPRPVVVFDRDRRVVEISELPTIPGSGADRLAEAGRNVRARHAAAARDRATGGHGPRDAGDDGFDRMVQRHALALSKIPGGPDAAIDHELSIAADRQARAIEIEAERRRLQFRDAPELEV